MQNTIWITWEKQRRTLELSKALGVKLFILDSKKKWVFRYLDTILKTLAIIIREKPRCLIVQNPSIVLAFVASITKNIMKYNLVVDRHTNFLLGKDKYDISDKIFMFMSNFSIRMSDLTIITNAYLKYYVETKKGKGFVLPDKLPEINVWSQLSNKLNNIVVFICTYAPDEPYQEVIEASRLLDPSIKIYITGNDKKVAPQVFKDIPDNVIITGYLSDDEYERLLNQSDIIMDFTKLDHCMVCGAYESVSLEKPLITSNTEALKLYFNKGVKHIKHSPGEISDAIMNIYQEYDNYHDEIRQLKADIALEWERRFNELKVRVDTLTH